MNYLMDANTYIQAKNVYYNMDFCPAFWDWLEKQFHAGQVMSIDNVYLELTDSTDTLSQWAKAHKAHFVSVADTATQATFTDIANYVVSLPGKSPVDIANFLSKADPWLIAKAITTGATVVTHEKVVDPASKKVKVPNICQQFNVSYMNTFQLLTQLQAQFVLGN